MLAEKRQTQNGHKNGNGKTKATSGHGDKSTRIIKKNIGQKKLWKERQAPMYEYKGMSYLQNQLMLKQNRVKLRYKYYEMKNIVRDLQISTPPALRFWSTSLGWCAKAVDSLADRLQFREFREDNFGMQEIFNLNNPDTLFDSAIVSALIASCCFVYISPDEDGFPRLQIIDAADATGIIDEQTGLLNEGYAVLKRDESGNAMIEAYFTAETTMIYYADGTLEDYPHKAGHTLLVPIIYKPDAVRPFGHSRISRSCMDYTAAAVRTIKRSEISAEFYSFPQKYMTGLADGAENQLESWSAAMSAMLAITKDEDGESPKLGQFTQQSQAPHVEQLKMIASLFAGECGLTTDDLGFSTSNPASSEAIKASHEILRLTARKAQGYFGTGFLNVGYVAACLRDEYAYKRRQIYLTTPVWEPIFEPDAAALSVIGDGAIKINQAIPGFFDTENLYDLTGIRPGGLL